MKNHFFKTLVLGLFFLALPIRQFGQEVKNHMIELELEKIENPDMRYCLLSHIANDDNYLYTIDEENNSVLLFSSNHWSDDQFQSFFNQTKSEVTSEFHAYLSTEKELQGNMFSSWKASLPQDLFVLLFRLMLIENPNNRDGNQYCVNSDPFCTSDIVTFHVDGSASGVCETGPAYGCMSPYTNRPPFWFHMKIGVAGTFTIRITNSNNLDLDFCAWGPFTDPTTPCPNQLTSDKIIDCDSPSNIVQECTIPSNAQVGQYYIMVITKYSSGSTNITFQKTAGSGPGETDCSILPPLVSSDGPYCVGETITLTGNAQSGATYTWSGPGGWTATGSTVTRPNCTLGMAGTYTCTIQVGNQSSSTDIDVVVNAQPIANFTATSACLGESTHFTNTSTTNPAGQSITSYLWNFGDGHTSTQQNPNHTYSAIGSYNVSLTVSVGTGNEACTDTKSGTEVVVYAQPIADFTATSVCRGEPTQFTSTSTTYPAGQNITSYLWNFGDGQSSTQQNPSHQYAEAGNYQVTLTVSCGNNTCTNTKTITVPVFAMPEANAGEDQTIDYGTRAQLNGSAGSGNFNYQWEPADKVVNPNAAQTQTVELTESQTFTLTATNQQGECVDSDNVNILVQGSAMSATANAEPASICWGETTSQLHANAVGGTGNYTYQWSPSMGLSDPVIANPIANPESTTTYTCTIFDGQTTKQVTATVTVNYPDYDEEYTQYICPNDEYPFYDQTCSEPGDYFHHTTTAQGCEKIITLHLHHYPSYENAHTTSVTLCPGEYYPFHGHNYDTRGLYPATLQTIHGCDSIVWLDLDFYEPNDTTIVDPAICTSQTYNFHGMLYSQDGDIAYFDTIDSHGCLKVEKMILSVGPYQMPPIQNEYVCYAPGETPSYYWDKTQRTYHQDISTDTILPDPEGGCDIKYRLNLKFHPEFDHYESIITCDEFTWDVTGETFYQTDHNIVREYPIAGGNQFRCDSTYVLDLTINHSNSRRETIYDQCDQYEWHFGWNGEINTLTERGIYTDTIETALGCDSIVTLDLRLDYSPGFPRVEGKPWVIGGSEFQYTREKYWITTNPKSTHSTEWALYDKNGNPFNKWDIDPFDNGDKCYLYIYTYERDSVELRAHTRSTGDCACGEETKSVWIHCSSYDVQEIIQRWNIDIYPNPNDGNMTLTLDNMIGDVTVKVFDLTGTLVDHFNLYNGSETQTHTYKSNKLAPGVYFFSFSNKEGSTTRKVIVY